MKVQLERIPTRSQRLRATALRNRERAVERVRVGDLKVGDRVQTRNDSGTLIGDWVIAAIEVFALGAQGSDADILHLIFEESGCSYYTRRGAEIEVIR